MSGWTPGFVPIRVMHDGAPITQEVVGLTKGPFGLDVRAFLDGNDELVVGYVLTHLATGFVVRQLHCGTEQAQAIADEIAAAADWSFADPADCARCRPAIADVMKRHPDIVRGDARTYGPQP